jgi:hypothetical protein
MLLASRANGSQEKNARWATNSLRSYNGRGSKGLAASGVISAAHCATGAVWPAVERALRRIFSIEEARF